jgi:hypothetical protein
MNNRLRCYLARLRRKTHCYTKSVVNLRDSLLFVFARRLALPTYRANLHCHLPTAVGRRFFNTCLAIPKICF